MEVKSGYKRTELGVIPEDWKVQRVGDLRPFVTSGSRGWAAFYSTWGSHFIRITNLSRGSIYLDLEDLRFVTLPKDESEGVRTQLREQDVLISITADIGIVGYVSSDVPNPAYINQHIALVRFDSSATCPKFVSYFLASERPQKLFRALTDSGAKAGMNLTTVQQIRLALPPHKAEQEAIAEALSEADAMVDSLDRLIAKKRLLKQGALQDLLTARRRLPGFSGSWRKRQLGEVSINCSSGATPYRGRPEYYRGLVKWITSGELNFNMIADTIEHISEEAVEKTNLKLHPAGTFLMAITGLEAAGTRGACGIVANPATTNQSCMAIYPTPDLKSEYLYYWYVLHGNRLALTYCQGTKQQSYTANLVRLLPIDLPPTVEEQAAIASVLREMDVELATLDAKLAKARLIKKAMMQELLTGRIRLV